MRLISDTALAVITVFQEAEGEPYVGKLAVAEVIRNRMRARYQSDGTLAGTVLRQFQFSGWNSNSPNRTRSVQIDDDSLVVKDCARAWTEANTGTDIAKGALLYLNPKLANPDWLNRVHIVAAFGNHQFFIEST